MEIFTGVRLTWRAETQAVLSAKEAVQGGGVQGIMPYLPILLPPQTQGVATSCPGSQGDWSALDVWERKKA